MPSPKQQEKLLQRFIDMPKDCRSAIPIQIFGNVMGLRQSGRIAWANPHAVIIQEAHDEKPLGTGSLIPGQEQDAVQKSLAMKINLVLQHIVNSRSDEKLKADFINVILESRKEGRRIDRHAGIQTKYVTKLNNAWYDINYIDMFSRITGTTQFWYYKPKPALDTDKTGILLYPIYEDGPSDALYMLQLPVHFTRNFDTAMEYEINPSLMLG